MLGDPLGGCLKALRLGCLVKKAKIGAQILIKEKKMKIRKILALVLASCLALTCLTACGSDTEDTTTDDTETEAAAEEEETEAEEEEAEEEASDLSGTVATDGSTSMESVIGYLSEAFMEANPDVTVTYNPTGSGSGITAVLEGTCDIGLSSRNLKDEEIEEGLEETVLCYDGIAIIVNLENTAVTDLTLDEIAQIFTGEITNWSELGGDDAEIVVIGREAGSGTRDGFESVTGTEDACVYSQELTSTGAVITAVESNTAAIGYASMASASADEVNILSVDGVSPSAETVLDGTYTLQRPFVFVTVEGEELSDVAQAFFDYCFTDEAAEYIEEAGCVPVE